MKEGISNTKPTESDANDMMCQQAMNPRELSGLGDNVTDPRCDSVRAGLHSHGHKVALNAEVRAQPAGATPIYERAISNKEFGNVVAVGLFAGAVIARRMGAGRIADAIEEEGSKHASWLQWRSPNPAGEAEYSSWLTQLEMTLWERTLQEQREMIAMGAVECRSRK